MTNENFAFDLVTSAIPAPDPRNFFRARFDSKSRIYKKIRVDSSTLEIRSCIKWKHDGDSNMVVMEIPILTGYAPYVERDV